MASPRPSGYSSPSLLTGLNLPACSRCQPGMNRSNRPIRIGTRGSALALWQTEQVRAQRPVAAYPLPETDDDPELLDDLPEQRLLVCLPGLDLPAGQLPPTGQPGGFGTPSGKHATRPKYDRRHYDLAGTGCGHGGRMPASGRPG